jgi:hypothetical protein
VNVLIYVINERPRRTIDWAECNCLASKPDVIIFEEGGPIWCEHALMRATKFKELLFIFPATAIGIAARILACRRLCRLFGLRFR